MKPIYLRGIETEEAATKAGRFPDWSLMVMSIQTAFAGHQTSQALPVFVVGMALQDVDEARQICEEMAGLPKAVRALLVAEVGTHSCSEGCGWSGPTCGACDADVGMEGVHEHGCILDDALTSAGLPTWESRQAARETMGYKR